MLTPQQLSINTMSTCNYHTTPCYDHTTTRYWQTATRYWQTATCYYHTATRYYHTATCYYITSYYCMAAGCYNQCLQWQVSLFHAVYIPAPYFTKALTPVVQWPDEREGRREDVAMSTCSLMMMSLSSSSFASHGSSVLAAMRHQRKRGTFPQKG